MYALALCAILAFGSGAAVSAEGAEAPVGVQAPSGAGTPGAAAGALGNASTVDETALVIDPGEGASGAQTTAPAAVGSTTGTYFLRMILVLALILGAMYVVFRLLRRASRPKLADEGAILVLASKSLGPGKAVHLVGLGGKAWLVGATDQSVSLIAEVEDKELVDGLSLKAVTETPQPHRDFASILTGILGQGRKNPRPGSGKGGASLFGTDYLERQRDRLKKYREPGP